MTRTSRRLWVVLAGLVLCQAALYWPSLTGRKVLLPLDILCWPGVYMPQTPENAAVVPQESGLSDLVYLFEPARRFAAAELHSGRLPSWAPYEYCGTPVAWPRYSPFLLLECLSSSPVVLAWVQLLASTIGGLGAFYFFRQALRVRFWAAAFAAWCFPLTGFLVLWQGYPTCAAVFWLPWLLLTTHKTLLRPRALNVAALALVTALTLFSGHLDVAGQVLLVGGLYAISCGIIRYHAHWSGSRARRAAGCLALGWLLGVLLASPYLLPVLQYTRTSYRLEQRRMGQEERPPIGLAVLPEVLLPDMYGSLHRGSFALFPQGQTSQQESTAAGYTGLVATLVLAPLAWCNRRRRWSNWLWLGLAVLGVSWLLDLPGIVQILRLPGLNFMSHNRLVFATSFALLALSATGLDELFRQRCHWRPWFQVPAFLLLAIGGWCLLRALFLPEPIATRLGQVVAAGNQVGKIHDLAGVQEVQRWFVHAYVTAVVLCALGFGAWQLLSHPKLQQSRLAVLLGFVIVGDLLWFAYGRNPQCDPALYYPRLPVFQQLAHAEPGRVMGYSCFPANLAQTQGLLDIRGYDGIDPAPIVELLDRAADTNTPVMKLTHAVTQWFIPRYEVAAPDGIKLPPILDMLGVRYVVFRGSPTAGVRPFLEGYDYWVLVNHKALPRAFVPERVEVVPDKQQRLAKLASEQFNPREVAYVEEPLAFPAACHGEAKILDEVPTQVRLATQMETAGLVVLADRWDKGWRAYLDEHQVPILRVNHALRAAVVPPGQHTLLFRYQPDSFRWGLGLAVFAAVILIALVGVNFLPGTRGKP